MSEGSAVPRWAGVNWIGLWTIVRREWSRLMRVPVQAFIAPWISALLFIFIFGFVVGGRIAHDRRPPLSRIRAARHPDAEHRQCRLPAILVADLFLALPALCGGIAGLAALLCRDDRGRAVGGDRALRHHGHRHSDHRVFVRRHLDQSMWEFLFWVVSVSVVFGLLGIIIGLWANNFEQLTILNVFFITPLSFVGGVFNTVSMLPGWMRWMAYANPFFYFINGLRHAMIGFNEANEWLGVGVTLALAAVMAVTVWRLFSIGYGLRE
jgi:ABC-2 type transport system permease protein